MTAKSLSIFLLVFSALLIPFHLLAEVRLSDSVVPQTQSFYCAEDESNENETKEGEDEEEEPDCD